MITQSFPSLRPKPAVVVYQHHKPPFIMGPRQPSQFDIKGAERFKITPEEFIRRDEIVKRLWGACHWYTGQILTPVSEKNRAKYGTMIKVEGVYRSYFDFHENEEWPKDDEPYILTVRPEKGANGGRILCTADFLMKAQNGGSC